MTEEFSGLHEDMYRFFWEIAFHNDESFYRDNLERYKREVKIPLYALAAKLIPAAQNRRKMTGITANRKNPGTNARRWMNLSARRPL